MTEIFTTQELAQDLSAFCPNVKTFLIEKFQDHGITVDKITIKSLFADDLFKPNRIRIDDGRCFELHAFVVDQSKIDFSLKEVK